MASPIVTGVFQGMLSSISKLRVSPASIVKAYGKDQLAKV
ncbi:Uncharacterised protein [Vibrio cholerae]|nr:Uncharacterised protein [Vibrio cholerae]